MGVSLCWKERFFFEHRRRRRQFENHFKNETMAPRARAKAATSSARGRLKDLTNGDEDKKTKPAKAAAKVSNTTTIKTQREKRCPDSRPSRMTASVVAMEASAEKKETHQSEKDEPIVLKTSRQQRHNKRRRTTTTSNNNNNNNNNNLEDDDLDVTCDETTRSLPAKRKLLTRRGANQTKRVEVEGKKKLSSFKFFFKFKMFLSLSLSLSLYIYIF